MGSGCSQNSVNVAPMPEPKFVFYVANATRHRIMVATANSMGDFGSEGIQAKLKVNTSIPFVRNAEFDLSKGNVSNNEVFIRPIGIGQYAKFSAKYYAISRLDAKGEQQLLVKQCATEDRINSVIVTDDGVIASVDLTNTGLGRTSSRNPKVELELPANLLKTNIWISAEDNKDLRPKEFFVANASGYPIFVLPCDGPIKKNDSGQFKAHQGKKMEAWKSWPFNGDSVVIFAEDNETKICQTAVEPRQSVVVVKQSTGDFLLTQQLEGNDIENKKWIVDGQSYGRGRIGKALDFMKSAFN